jgi:thiosulfate/3-mercaptopyruvate sulfurtransferase
MMKRTLSVLLIVVTAPQAIAQVATDPPTLEKPTVVSTAWVAEHLDDAGLVIIDARPELHEYLKAHLAGAVYVNIENLRGTIGGVPAMLLPANELATRFAAMGVGNDTPVIIYADRVSPPATYVALALDRLGHMRHAIMEGGITKWEQESRPTTTLLPKVTVANFAPPARPDDFTATLDDVRAIMAGGNAVYVDTRPGRAFNGQGHWPGASNRPSDADLSKGDALIWAPLGDLQSAYGQIGAKDGTPVIVGCTTGHSASQAYFTLRHVLGYENVRWFDGSFAQYSTDPTCTLEKTTEPVPATQSAPE